MQLRVFQHGAIEDIFQAGLKMADDISIAQDLFAFFLMNVAVQLQNDVIHRQRAGLVRAKHVHRAEVLNRVEPLDDDLLARHRHRALGQADRHNHRQHFRRESDGDRHRKEKCFAPIVFR